MEEQKKSSEGGGGEVRVTFRSTKEEKRRRKVEQIEGGAAEEQEAQNSPLINRRREQNHQQQHQLPTPPSPLRFRHHEQPPQRKHKWVVEEIEEEEEEVKNKSGRKGLEAKEKLETEMLEFSENEKLSSGKLLFLLSKENRQCSFRVKEDYEHLRSLFEDDFTQTEESEEEESTTEEDKPHPKLRLLQDVVYLAVKKWEFQKGFMQNAVQQTITAVKSAGRAYVTGNSVMRHYLLWRAAALPSNAPKFEFEESLETPNSLRDLLLYHCIYQTSGCGRSIGANMVWLLFHLARLRLGLEDGKSADTTANAGQTLVSNPLGLAAIESLETLGDWLLRLNFELDAFLHVVFDCKVLNRTVLQHHDINALAITPQFVSRVLKHYKVLSATFSFMQRSPSSNPASASLDSLEHVTSTDSLASLVSSSSTSINLTVTSSSSTTYPIITPDSSLSTLPVFSPPLVEPFSFVRIFLQTDLVGDDETLYKTTHFPLLLTLQELNDPFYVRSTLSSSGFTHLPNQFDLLSSDQRKHFEAFTERVISKSEELGITSPSMLTSRQLWDSLLEEARELSEDWKVYNDQNGGFLGFRAYNTLVATTSPVIILTTILISFCGWWTFGFNWRAGDIALQLVLLSIILYSLAVTYLWTPTFMKQIRALGGVTCPRVDSTIDSDLATKNIYEKTYFWLGTLWILILGFLFLVLRWVAFEHLRPATVDLLRNSFELYPLLSIIRVSLHWLPALIIILVVTQFVYCFFASIFSLSIGYGIGLTQFHSWKEVTRDSLERGLRRYSGYCLNITDINDQEIAGALVWNQMIDELYMRDMLTTQDRYDLSFELNEHGDVIEELNECSGRVLLNQEIVRWPKLENPPSIGRATDYILLFLRSSLLSSLPPAGNIAEMASVCRALPVGAREPIYPSWAELNTMQNTGTTVLRHLLQLYGDEFDCFRNRLWPTDKEDVESTSSFTKENKAINKQLLDLKIRSLERKSVPEDIPDSVKLDICIWASMRTVCTFRNLFAHTGVNRALHLIARLQNPDDSAEAMARIVNSRMRFVVGFQGYKDPTVLKLRESIRLAKTGRQGAKNHFTWMLGQLDMGMRTDYNIETASDPSNSLTTQPTGISMTDINKAIRSFNTSRVGMIEFVYQTQTPDGTWWSKIVNTQQKTGIEVAPIDGPFTGVGFGKSWNQNFMAPFLTMSEVLWTLDVNQDFYPGQPFFLPCAVKKFDDPSVHLVALQDDFMNQDWNAIAFASSLSNRTFSAVANKVMALVGVRFHYGHSDLLRSSYAMGSSGLSQINILSEDVTLGMDIALKGGTISYVDLGVPKSKDTDILSMTKFERKVAGGAPQILCCYLWWQLCTSPHFGAFTWRHPVRGVMNILRRMSLFYTLCGWYVNHTIIVASVFCLFIGLVILETLDQVVIVSGYSKTLTVVFIYWHMGTILTIPGLIQLTLDYGWNGFCLFWKRFFPSAMIGLFHVLNTAIYFHKGTQKAPVYRFSGRGDGLSHVGLKVLWDSFKGTHFPFGLFFLACGFFFLAFNNPLQFLMVVFIPAWVWMSGCILLDQGTIGIDIRLRDWKQLFLVDLFEMFSIFKSFRQSRREKSLRISEEESSIKRWSGKVWNGVGALRDVLLSINLIFVLLAAYTPGLLVMFVRLVFYSLTLLHRSLKRTLRVMKKSQEGTVTSAVPIVLDNKGSEGVDELEEEEEVLEDEMPRLSINVDLLSLAGLSAAIAQVEEASAIRSSRRKRAVWRQSSFNPLAHPLRTNKNTTPRTPTTASTAIRPPHLPPHLRLSMLPSIGGGGIMAANSPGSGRSLVLGNMSPGSQLTSSSPSTPTQRTSKALVSAPLTPRAMRGALLFPSTLSTLPAHAPPTPPTIRAQRGGLVPPTLPTPRTPRGAPTPIPALDPPTPSTPRAPRGRARPDYNALMRNLEAKKESEP